MTPNLKIALVGCGRIAQLVHLNVLTRLPGVDLVALAEIDSAQRAEASRKAPQAAALADYRELLARPDVEAVVICLPNGLHAEVAVAALRQGKHVYLEKPLATTLRGAEEILAAWQPTKAVGMIGFNYRFNALYQSAKQYIQSGRLGELIGARSVFCTAARSLPEWKRRRESGGGVLLDLASHHVDLVPFLLGREVQEVFAMLGSGNSQDDSAMLHLRLRGGAEVQSFFSRGSVEEDRFEIYGSEAKLTVDRHRFLNLEVSDCKRGPSRIALLRQGMRSLLTSPYALDKVFAPTREPSYQAALAHFAAAVSSSDRTVSPNFWDGYRSLAIIAAAEESARTGRVVSLPDVTEENKHARARATRP